MYDIFPNFKICSETKTFSVVCKTIFKKAENLREVGKQSDFTRKVLKNNISPCQCSQTRAQKSSFYLKLHRYMELSVI